MAAGAAQNGKYANFALFFDLQRLSGAPTLAI